MHKNISQTRFINVSIKCRRIYSMHAYNIMVWVFKGVSSMLPGYTLLQQIMDTITYIAIQQVL